MSSGVQSVCLHFTARYLSFDPMAQCVVHTLKGLACRARATQASSPASHCKQCLALTSPLLHACARQSFLCSLRSQKHNIFQRVQNFGTPRYTCYSSLRSLLQCASPTCPCFFSPHDTPSFSSHSLGDSVTMFAAVAA
jgi:hypothetical protein